MEKTNTSINHPSNILWLSSVPAVWARLICASFCLLSFLWLAKALFLGYYPDFNTQYYVPKLVFSGVNPYLGGSNLYTPQAYPPTVSLFYFPLSLLPLGPASYLFTIISTISLIAALLMLSKIFAVKFFSNINLLLMGLAFMMFPVKFTLGMGQINLIVLFLLVISLWSIKQKKHILSGIFLGVSIVLKLFPLFLPIYLLIGMYSSQLRSNNIRTLVGILSSCVVAIIIVFIFVPWDISIYFLTQTLPSILGGWKLDYYNQSLSGFIGRSFGIGEFANLLKNIISGLLVLLTFIIILKNKQKDFMTTCLIFGCLITLNLIVNTFSWQHHFVWMIVPLYAVFFYIRINKFSKKYFVILGISCMLMNTNLVNPDVVPVVLRSHVFFGGFILLLLQLKLLLTKKTFMFK